jgi:hypothetical protein
MPAASTPAASTPAASPPSSFAREVYGGSMRLVSVFTLLAACFVCSTGSVGSKSAAEQPDVSRSGSGQPELCHFNVYFGRL